MMMGVMKSTSLWQCVCGVLFGVLCFFILQAGYAGSNKPTIVTVNLRGMTNAYVQQLTREHLTQPQAQERVKQFSVALEHVLQGYSAQHHVVLMPQEAVIEGAPDATLIICKNLKLIQACKV